MPSLGAKRKQGLLIFRDAEAEDVASQVETWRERFANIPVFPSRIRRDLRQVIRRGYLLPASPQWVVTALLLYCQATRQPLVRHERGAEGKTRVTIIWVQPDGAKGELRFARGEKRRQQDLALGWAWRYGDEAHMRHCRRRRWGLRYQKVVLGELSRRQLQRWSPDTLQLQSLEMQVADALKP